MSQIAKFKVARIVDSDSSGGMTGDHYFDALEDEGIDYLPVPMDWPDEVVVFCSSDGWVVKKEWDGVDRFVLYPFETENKEVALLLTKERLRAARSKAKEWHERAAAIEQKWPELK